MTNLFAKYVQRYITLLTIRCWKTLILALSCFSQQTPKTLFLKNNGTLKLQIVPLMIKPLYGH